MRTTGKSVHMRNISSKKFAVAAILLGGALLAAVSCGGRKKMAGTEADSSVSEIKASARQVVSLSDSLLNFRGADTVDMGRMKKGEVVMRTVTLHNAGDKPMVVTGVDKSCGCVEASYTKTPVKPGESGEMELGFDSNGLSGWVYKTLGVHTSLGQKPYVLVITADVE